MNLLVVMLKVKFGKQKYTPGDFTIYHIQLVFCSVGCQGELKTALLLEGLKSQLKKMTSVEQSKIVFLGLVQERDIGCSVLQ